MKKLIITSLLITSSLMLNSQSVEKNFIDQNYIEVTGKAQMEITPDVFYLQILVSEKDPKTKVSLSETEQKMISKLKEIGIDVSKDLAIKDLSSSFQAHFLAKTDILLSKEYRLKLFDTKTLGKVFSELEAIGISNVRILKVESSKILEYRNEVKVNAIKAAKEKASLLATAINQTIGRALYIMENNQYQTYSRASNSINSNSIQMDEINSETLDFEKISFDYSVLVRFELK